MKKTTKLLVLMALVALVFACSAFFAHAVEENEDYFQDVVVWTDVNYESMADDYKFDADKNFGSPGFGGVVIYCTSYQDNGYRGGSIESLVAPDGTKSLVYYSTTHTSKSSPYISDYLGDAPSKTGSKHSLTNYSYFSVDFDLKSPTGFYDNASNSDALRLESWFYYVNTAETSKSSQKQMMNWNTNDSGITELVTNGKTYQLKKSDVWQHYTLIFKIYDKVNSDGNSASAVDAYIFVDGEYITTFTVFDVDSSNYYVSPESGEHDTSLNCFREIRINIPSRGVNSTTQQESVAVDNWKVKSFSNFYQYKNEIDQVTTGYIDLVDWKEAVYTKDYDYPFNNLLATVLDAKGKVVGYYDDFKAAFDAAEEGYTVKIHDNVTDEDNVVVNKNVIVDARYDANGKEQAAPYGFKFISDKYSATLEEGIYLLKRTQNSTVKFFWDMPVGVSATDNSLFKITSSVLGATPVYPDEIEKYYVKYDAVDTDKIVAIYRFEGWSYTAGGEVEALRPVTVEDLENPNGAWCALYPVYSYCDVKVTKPNGRVYYCAFSDISDEVKAAPGLTFTLLDDVVTSKPITFANDAVIDFAGYDYTYVAGAANGAAFEVAAGATLTLSSSVKGADIFAVAAVGNEAKGAAVAKLTGGLAVDGENLTVYTAQLFTVDASATADIKVDVDGGAYYRTINDDKALINMSAAVKLTVNINNAILASNTANANVINLSSAPKNAAIVLNECTVYAEEAGAIVVNSEGAKAEFNDCKIFADVEIIAGTATVGYGTLVADLNGEAEIVKKCKMFELPAGHKDSTAELTLAFNEFTVADGSVANSSYVVADATKEMVFTAIVAGTKQLADGTTETNVVNVEWRDPTGELISTDYTYPGTTTELVPPEFTYVWAVENGGDGWRNMIISKWKNAEEKINEFAIPETAEAGTTAVFNGILPASDDPEAAFNAAPTKLLWNLVFGESVNYNFYVPKEDKVTVNSLVFGDKALTLSEVVTIGDDTYYIVSVGVDMFKMHETADLKINYTIDGKTYEYDFVAMSALTYASALLEKDVLTDTEEAFLLNYIRYASMALARVDSEANAVAYEAFFAKYTAPEFTTEYPDAELNAPDASVNESAANLMNFVKSISYEVGADGKIKFVVEFRTAGEYKEYTSASTSVIIQKYSIYDASGETELVSKTSSESTVLTIEGIDIADLKDLKFTLGVTCKIPKKTYMAEYSFSAFMNDATSETPKYATLSADDLEFYKAVYALSSSWEDEFEATKLELK